MLFIFSTLLLVAIILIFRILTSDRTSITILLVNACFAIIPTLMSTCLRISSWGHDELRNDQKNWVKVLKGWKVWSIIYVIDNLAVLIFVYLLWKIGAETTAPNKD